MEEVVKQKKDKTELVKKLSLSTGVLAFAAVLFGILGLLSFFNSWEVGSFNIAIFFAISGITIAFSTIVMAIIVGIFFLKFQINMSKMKNKTIGIINIVFSISIVVLAILTILLGEMVDDMIALYGLIVIILVGIALGIIDILSFVFINKNKNPKVQP